MSRKLRKKIVTQKNSFCERARSPSESSSDSEEKQILIPEHSDQTQKPVSSDGEKQSPIEGPRRKQKQGDNAPPRPRRLPNSQTDVSFFAEFENRESMGPRDDLVRSGDNETRYESKSITEGSCPDVSRGEELRAMASDGNSMGEANDNF
jgi:hypothetical protein